MGKCTINGKEYAFSVGDRVKTKGSFLVPAGIGTVVGIKDLECYYLVSLDGWTEGHSVTAYELIAGKLAPNKSNWWFNEDELTLLTPEMKSIHITTDGKTTHAVLKDGNKVVKRSKAICSPADTFDFETGARVAFDRLISPEVREVKRPAKVGEWVKATRSARGYVVGEVLQVISGLQNDHTYIYVRTEKPTNYSGNAATHKIKQPFSLMEHTEYVVLENYQPPEEPEEPELPKFTYEGFKRGDFAVNCRTQEEADIFCAYLHGKGDKWVTGDSYMATTNWDEHKGNTVYYGDGCFGNANRANAPVIPFNAADLD